MNKINEQIAELIVRYLTGSISFNQLKRLEAWLTESEEHTAIFEEIKTAWILDKTNTVSTKISEDKVWRHIVNKIDRLKRIHSLERRKKLQSGLRRAAGIMLIVGVSTILAYLLFANSGYRQESDSFVSTIYDDTLKVETQKGFRTEIFLPDGSRVWLNSDSQLKYSSEFHEGNRKIYLSGEAYFDVLNNRNDDPFRVSTGDVQIKVSGTEFNVKSYPESQTIEAVVKEGKVAIEKVSKDQILELAVLNPDELAIIVEENGPRTNRVIIQKNVNTDIYTSWKEGHLIFKDEQFHNIVRGMERWYGVEIEVKDPEMNKLLFTANFKNETIEQALKALQFANDFEYIYDVENNLVTIE